MSVEFLYVTADAVGTETGGGVVTKNEVEALRTFAFGAPFEVWAFPRAERPWGADEEALARLLADPTIRPTLAHFYSGTFTETIVELQARGCAVTYTCAAHDAQVSRAEHAKLGLPFDYPHLTEATQWAKYVRGYQLADAVVCPSSMSAACMSRYDCPNVTVIPHGVDLPERVAPPPQRFSVAYLGQPGPDKGLIYLLEAWARLDYDNVLLTIAGRGTEHLLPFVRSVGGGSIYLRGEVDDVSEIYNGCALYVQPSASEGFGIEVLEAYAHGRPVICSAGAGAADIVPPRWVVPARNSRLLAESISRFHLRFASDDYKRASVAARVTAESLSWDLVRERYIEFWRLR